MKSRYFVFFIGIIGLSAGCMNAEEDPADFQDIELLRDYAASDSLDYTETDDGLFYAFIRNDTDTRQTDLRDVVKINYQILDLDGNLLEELDTSQAPVAFRHLSNQIIPQGLDLVTQHASENDIIKVLIPGFWTYGFGQNMIAVLHYQSVLRVDQQYQLEIEELHRYADTTGFPVTDTVSFGTYLHVISKGDGNPPQQGSNLEVAYTGKVTSGSVFDESDSFTFTLGTDNIIDSWNQSFATLPVGSEAVIYTISANGYADLPLFIPHALGGANLTDLYERGIKPFTPLIFEVELKSIE